MRQTELESLIGQTFSPFDSVAPDSGRDSLSTQILTTSLFLLLLIERLRPRAIVLSPTNGGKTYA